MGIAPWKDCWAEPSTAIEASSCDIFLLIIISEPDYEISTINLQRLPTVCRRQDSKIHFIIINMGMDVLIHVSMYLLYLFHLICHAFRRVAAVCDQALQARKRHCRSHFSIEIVPLRGQSEGWYVWFLPHGVNWSRLKSKAGWFSTWASMLARLGLMFWYKSY